MQQPPYFHGVSHVLDHTRDHENLLFSEEHLRKSPNLPIPRNLFILYVPTSFRDTAALFAQLIVLLEWRTLPAIKTSAALQLRSFLLPVSSELSPF